VFPIAHAWLLEQLVPDPSPAHYLGCIWPDMLFASPLSHPQTHREGARLATHAAALRGKDADLVRQFVAGALTHGSEPHGFDWYSDEQWNGAGPHARGYAFQKGRALAAGAAVACDVPSDAGWWKAHNLVEMAFERPLYTANPALGERLLAACQDEALVSAIAAELARIFSTEREALALPMRRFPQVSQLGPSTVASLAETYAMQTRLKHDGAQPDPLALARLIERAEDLVAADRDTYLATCVPLVGTMLRETLPEA
jgi:hypothetical protein